MRSGWHNRLNAGLRPSQFFQHALLAPLLGAMVACTNLSTSTLPAELPDREIEGRFSIRFSDHAQVEQAPISGRFRYQRGRHATGVWLLSPLGSVVAEVMIEAAQTRVRTAEGHDVVGNTPEDALSKVTNFPFPMSAARQWLDAADPTRVEIPGWSVRVSQTNAAGKVRRVEFTPQVSLPSERLVGASIRKLILIIDEAEEPK